MTIRTFWTFLLKLMGLWLILSGFSVTTQLFSMLGYLAYGDQGTIQFIMALIGSLLALAIYTAVILFIVFKPGYIIDKLKLDKGFQEETISLNIRMNTVLSISVIVLGGIMFLDALPLLCREIINFMRGTDLIMEYPNIGNLVFLLVKTLIGYLLMTNSKPVVGFMTRKGEKVEQTTK